MPYRWTLAVAITGYFMVVALSVHWPEREPAPFHFKSLKGLSDDEIADFMSGTRATDSFHPLGAPDNNFPGNLWNTDPKSAALAFANANRTPEHRKLFQLTMDENPAIKAPDAGWFVLDDHRNQTGLRFGIEQSFLFHAGVNYDRSFSRNPYTDRSSHSLQIIPLTHDEARFLSHTVFWLEHIQSECKQKGYSESPIMCTHEGYGMLDWFIAKQASQQISGTLWSFHPISCRWCGNYDQEANINLTNHLLTEALPKHLGKRWDSENTHPTPLKPEEEDAARNQLTDVILSALDHHFDDPWPAPALIALANCAGDAGISETLPSLEKLAAQQLPPSADETELNTLKDQFRNSYKAPEDPEEKKQWERYQSLRDKLDDIFHPQLRRPLAQAIRQLRALDHPAQLVEMAKSDNEGAIWALQQLLTRQPEAYADVLTAIFRSADKTRNRRLVFETMAAANPAVARRLRDTLTEKKQTELLIEITKFEITDAPTKAHAHIPALLEIFMDSEKLHDSSDCAAAIDLLAKLPLGEPQQRQFERLLLNELLESRHKDYTTSNAVAALLTHPDPDRYWDTLIQSGAVCSDSYGFQTILDGLANLALANPEPRLAQLTEFLRPRFTHHTGVINDLSLATLALDLRPLAPELQHLATSGPQVPDGEYSPDCDEDSTSPCRHRYHSARHVIALWMENDTDTRARMWSTLLLNSPYKFVGTTAIPSSLRNRCSSAVDSASPELRRRLIAQIRSNPDILRKLPNWLAGFPKAQ